MPKAENIAIEVAVRNAGLRSAWTAMTWALDWGMLDAKGELSGSLSARTAAVGKWWGYSEAKAWRRHCAFRKAFPMFETPSDLIAVPANQPLRDFLDAFAKMSKVVDAAKLGKGMAFMTGAAVT